MKLDLVTIGDSTIDTFIYPQEVETFCTVKPEECHICFNYGDKVPVKNLEISVGGNAANHAVAAARLGLTTAIITIIGDDLAGDQILARLKKENVLTDWVTIQVQGKTNHSTIISLGNERTILSYHAPRLYRLPAQVPITSWLFLTSVGEGFEPYYEQVASWATSNKIHLAFAPGSRQTRSGLSAIKPTLKSSEILFVNRQEAGKITGLSPDTSPKTLLKTLFSYGPKIIFITDNIKGSYAFDGQSYYLCDALITQTTEITGAGDAYAAGTLAAIIAGQPFSQAMLQGTINASSVVSHIGAQTGLLKKHQIPDWLLKAKSAKVKSRKI